MLSITEQDGLKELGRRVRELRVQERFTQSQFALVVGIYQSRLSLIEAGQVVPRLDELIWIAEVLSVPVGRLLPEGFELDLEPHEIELIFHIRQIRDGEKRSVVLQMVRDYAFNGGRK